MIVGGHNAFAGRRLSPGQQLKASFLCCGLTSLAFGSLSFGRLVSDPVIS
jgi:hypothetical protein